MLIFLLAAGLTMTGISAVLLPPVWRFLNQRMTWGKFSKTNRWSIFLP